MTEFEDLLAGIRANPADELRRLVFADWLDENAHADPLWAPWASYIRWGVNSIRTPRTDPDYWKYRRYPETPPDLTKLLGIGGQPAHFVWTGGFPDQISLSVDTLQAHDWRLAAILSPIRRMTVYARYVHREPPPGYPAVSPQPPVPTEWVSGPTVARVGELDVGANEVDAPALLTALANHAERLPPLFLRLGILDHSIADLLANRTYPSLVGLTLSGLDDPEPLARSGNLTGVKSLTLQTVGGSEGRYTCLPQRMPQLKSLSVGGSAQADFFRALAEGRCSTLTNLETSCLSAESPGWAEFVSSTAFSSLTRMVWRGYGIQDSDAPIWSSEWLVPAAGELILNVAGIGPSHAVELFGSAMLARCSCLFAEHSELPPQAYLALANNPAAQNLKVLSLQRAFKSDPVISGPAFAELCRSNHLAGLTELSLTFHYLTDEDFDELLTATFAENLRYLNLAGSYISERSLAKLLESAVLPELTWLDIHGPKGVDHPLGTAFRKRFGPNFAF